MAVSWVGQWLEYEVKKRRSKVSVVEEWLEYQVKKRRLRVSVVVRGVVVTRHRR